MLRRQPRVADAIEYTINVSRQLKWIVLLAVLTPSFSNSVLINPNKKKGAGPLFQLHRGKQWGFMDRTGKIVIPPQFEAEGDFFNGLARVLKDDKWGYIDQTGRLVIEYRFEHCGDFVEGLAPVQVGRDWGYIDPSGKFIIQPQFQGAAEFRDGLARFEVWDTIHCESETLTRETAPTYQFFMHYPSSTCRGGRYGFLDHGGAIASPRR